MRERFDAHQDAMASLEPYGLTSAESVLPHYVAGREALMEHLQETPVNSLDFPRYEFFYPWDYAYQRQTQFIANHVLIMDLKKSALMDFLENLEMPPRDKARIHRSIAAEFRYLDGFREFLEGMPLEEQYRVFDDALAVAPWNDSLRARIYLQYLYNASTRRIPAERTRLMERAKALYPER